LKTFTTTDEFFKKMNKYMISKNINWTSCIRICTDGAVSMTGIYSSVVSHVEEVAHAYLISICYFINREHLTVKNMDENVNDILNQCTTIINFIPARAIFSVMCEEFSSIYNNVLLIWLAKVAYLTDIFSLLYLCMQGLLTNICTSNNKVEDFLKKLDLWIKRIQENTYDMIPHIIL
jgi:hypothetical protein